MTNTVDREHIEHNRFLWGAFVAESPLAAVSVSFTLDACRPYS